METIVKTHNNIKVPSFVTLENKESIEKKPLFYIGTKYFMDNNNDPDIKIMPRKDPTQSKLVNKEWLDKNYMKWLQANA